MSEYTIYLDVLPDETATVEELSSILVENSTINPFTNRPHSIRIFSDYVKFLAGEHTVILKKKVTANA